MSTWAEWEKGFWDFARHWRLTSKDEGVVPFVPWNTQRYVIGEIFRGLQEGVREFYILKCRQVGMTAIGLILDCFWNFAIPGLQSCFATDSEENREFFRATLLDGLKGLPASYRVPLKSFNRHAAKWANGSRMLFQVAGLKAGKTLGRARGLNHLHATEFPFWGSAAGVESLHSALSTRHWGRLYLWEGTANGYNHGYDMWQSAQHAVTIRPLFLTWWRHRLYVLTPRDRAYGTYWDGKLTGEETIWQRQIASAYGVTLTPGQWAWYRYTREEHLEGDQMAMHEEFPCLPEQAFQASGESFLGVYEADSLLQAVQEIPKPEWYNYRFSTHVEETICAPSGETGTLAIWEEPQPNTLYIVASDCAFGSSPTSDRSVAQVWKATRERLSQVAEFASAQVGLQQFAWVTLHLAGTYAPATVILELNGPGMGVWQEMQRLEQMGWGSAMRPQDLAQVWGAIEHYIWRRPDSMAGSMAWQWKTNPQNKLSIYLGLRDQLRRGAVKIRSRELVRELATVRQQEDRIGGHGRAHDDRVAASAMAVQCWMEKVFPRLSEGMPESPAGPPNLVRTFFDQLRARAQA